MKLKEIGFYFENCEYISIDGKYVGYFLVDDIRTSIERIACNSIIDMKIPRTFAVEIHKDANIIHNPFGDKRYDKTKFERLMEYDDITQIDFTLVKSENDFDETVPSTKEISHHLNVSWKGNNDYSNEAQTSYLSKNGHLYIVISQDISFEEIIDKEYVDHEDYDFPEWI